MEHIGVLPRSWDEHPWEGDDETLAMTHEQMQDQGYKWFIFNIFKDASIIYIYIIDTWQQLFSIFLSHL